MTIAKIQYSHLKLNTYIYHMKINIFNKTAISNNRNINVSKISEYYTINFIQTHGKKGCTENTIDTKISQMITGSMPASQSTSRAQGDGQLLQLENLQQLHKLTERLDQVKEQMSSTVSNPTQEKQELSTDSFSIKSCKTKKTKPVSSSSSLHDSDEPSLEWLNG